MNTKQKTTSRKPPAALPAKKTPQKKTLQKNTASPAQIAVVRLRGNVPATQEIKDTLRLLNLKRVNTCSLFGDTPSVRGMLQTVGGFVTWGIVNEGTVKRLKEKRGDGNVFRLSPTTLRSKLLWYPKGDLGFRGEKINSLLQEML